MFEGSYFCWPSTFLPKFVWHKGADKDQSKIHWTVGTGDLPVTGEISTEVYSHGKKTLSNALRENAKLSR